MGLGTCGDPPPPKKKRNSPVRPSPSKPTLTVNRHPPVLCLTTSHPPRTWPAAAVSVSCLLLHCHLRLAPPPPPALRVHPAAVASRLARRRLLASHTPPPSPRVPPATAAAASRPARHRRRRVHSSRRRRAFVQPAAEPRLPSPRSPIGDRGSAGNGAGDQFGPVKPFVAGAGNAVRGSGRGRGSLPRPRPAPLPP
ncbi:hypothetical protein PVAP13_4NG063432 [Panicum virgatum]|uniref:Uncharacterized protein n=1 Tax=Panicum virgatum TaxID=38727 RepID=A0A8T0T5F5_PANVG|nr:hypothetical protein PVAP13_4NG063432 [Panicum virgatum]